MKASRSLPRLLIIDDLYGRTLPNCRNEERARLCGQYLLEDITGDEVGKTSLRINSPIAQVIFHRGQSPHQSVVGDTVENDLDSVINFVREGWTHSNQAKWSLVLLDLCFYTGSVTEESSRRTVGMPEGRNDDHDPNHYFGLQILESIHKEFPDLPIVILSSKSRSEVSLEFTTKGALGFLSRGDDDSPETLKDYIWKHGLIPDESGDIIGNSKPIMLVLRAARRAALSRKNVLLRGERGTGKELLARYINLQRLPPKAGAFVTINSAVFTTELFASELFGIEPRTATQVEARIGLIEKARGGDLFFDEIKDMPLQVQAAILRVIEQREFIRVGGRAPSKIDVRFLSATNADLEAIAAVGNFRLDLLDRLREGGSIYLPPLRERKEDIPLIVEKFVRSAERDIPGAMRREIELEALDKLCDYDWPGNIRELRECIFKAVSEYPDVEHLVPSHIEILLNKSSFREETAGLAAPIKSHEDNDLTRINNNVDELIRAIELFWFNPENPSSLAGKLPKLKRAYTGLLARYLAAALKATRKPTPENPDGEIHISPALKLMRGEKLLTTSQAADEIKRILKECKDVKDPILQEALDYVLMLRPRNPKTP